ncbi:MAG: hypothetical protein HY690_06305 [Chloroflexi bacterium]|nr:hypothetical protein [Chloroflexota bacterium]
MPPALDLGGEWQFSPDGRSWGAITVPGCWEAQGYPASLEGPVVYQRRFAVPETWQGQQASLRFGAASYQARVWLNGRYLGRHQGMWDSFALAATPWLRVGSENELRVEVVKPGHRFPWQDTLAGFVPEVAMPFGGLWQPVELRPHGDLVLGRPWVRANLRGAAVANVEVQHLGAAPCEAELEAEVFDPSGSPVAQVGQRLSLSPGQREVRLPFQLRDPLLWEPEAPHRYLLRLRLSVGGVVRTSAERPFGVRELRARGHQVWLNGRPVLLRGVLHWGFYPRTIAPTPTEAELRDELSRVRALGFNLVKHCLFVPPETYQDLADEVGMLLWQELPLWPPTVSPAQRRRALQQYPILVGQRRGHPSLVLYTLGCELNSSADAPFLRRLYRSVKRLAPDTLVRDNSGSGECYGGLLVDFADFYDYHLYAQPEHLGPLMDAFAAPWRRTRPWLFGEFLDSDTFRSVTRLRDQLGAGEDWWLSHDLDRNPLAERQALLDQPRRLQAVELPCDEAELERRSFARSLVLRKQVLELVRRYPSLSGYVVTTLRDVPLWAAGLFDDLGRAKWSPEELAAFNADTVVLLCPPPRRSWIAGGDRLVAGETYCAWGGGRVWRPLVVSHFGRGVLRAALRWRVEDERGTVVAEGEPRRVRLQAGVVQEMGVLDFQAPEVAAPRRLAVHAWLDGHEPPVRNAWPLWLFPRGHRRAETPAPSVETPAPPGRSAPSTGVRLHDPGGRLAGLAERFATPDRAEGGEVLVASCADEVVLEHVRQGGRALVLQSGAGLLPIRRLPFWREGLPLIFPHPALAAFPHDGYADLAWESLATDQAVDSPRLSAALEGATEHRPIVHRLDLRDFSPADYAGELRLGQGRLVYTTLAFEHAASPEWGLERCPFASFLLDQLVGWLAPYSGPVKLDS